jgi:isopenicillin-N N-acyltransferase-like protein
MRFTFKGDARERGRQHGRALRDQIHARIASALPLSDVEDRSALARPWLTAIDALGGPIGTELRGIADGSGAALADVVLLNAFEAFEVQQQVELGGCTSVALVGRPGTAPQGTVIAQNWDANPSLAASVAVHVHSGPDTPTTVLVASPGGLGWIGMTAAGVALVNNDLLTRAVRHGVPSQAMRRHALLQPTARAAVEAITSTPAVGGRSYLVGDATGDVLTVELAVGAGPAVVRHAETAAHTNHALDPLVAAHEDPALLAATYPSSGFRLRRALDLIAAVPSAGSCRDVLADHSGYPLSICRHPSPDEPTVTAVSAIFDCAARRATIALGNPCAAPTIDIDLAVADTSPECRMGG